MKITKRIFAVVLAFMLAFSYLPFMSIVAEASNLGGSFGENIIKFSSGYGATGGSVESNHIEDKTSVKLPDDDDCGFEKKNATFKGWKINGVFYPAGSEYKYDIKNSVSVGVDNVIYAEAVWESSSGSGSGTSSTKGITATFFPGEDEDENPFENETYFTKVYSQPVEGQSGYYHVTFPECPFTPKGYKFLGWRVHGVSGEYIEAGATGLISDSNFSATAMWEKVNEGVTVNNVGDVKSIAIKTKPKTSYKIGDTFSSSGLVITATKKDGSTEDISSGFTVSLADGTKFEKSGDQTVTVTYKNLTATFNVTVKSNSSSSSSASSSKPASSSSSSSVAPSTSSSSSESSSETSSESSSAPEVEEPEVFEPISLAYSISGDVPVTAIEFLLKEDIGVNPQLRVMAIDSSSATDAATTEFIAKGDALAAFDLSLLADGLAYHGDSLGTVNYTLNGTQANAECRFDSYVLAMVHVTNIGDYDGDYYMTDGENTYLYTPETDFKAAVSNIALVEEDGVNRLVIRSVSGLSSFAYQAAANVIVEVKLLPSASDSTGSIDVTSLSPVLLVQLEVGDGSSSGFAIPFWVWIIVGVVVLLVIILVVLYLINRQNERKRFEETRRNSRTSSTYSITGFDDEE